MTEKRSDKQDRAENKDSGGYRFNDPKELAHNIARMFAEGGKVLNNFASRSNGQTGPYSATSEAGEAVKVLSTVAKQWAKNPAGFVSAQGRLYQGYADLWGRSMRRFLGEEVEPVATPEPGDARFKDADWNDSQYFDFWKQNTGCRNSADIKFTRSSA